VQVAGSRYYNPGLGRWASRDPIEERGGHALFGYVDNQPVAKWDGLGLWPGWRPCVEIGIVRDSGWMNWLATPVHYTSGGTIGMIGQSNEVRLHYVREVVRLFACNCCWSREVREVTYAYGANAGPVSNNLGHPFFWNTQGPLMPWPPPNLTEWLVHVWIHHVATPTPWTNWDTNAVNSLYDAHRPARTLFGTLMVGPREVPRTFCLW
jgi:hypothetical protein